MILVSFLTSCNIKKDNSIEKIQSNNSVLPIENDQVESTSTYFSGNWYCSRENSCNDMDITLTITEQDGCVSVDRNMVSDSGVGSSHLQYEAKVTDNNTLYSDYVDGVYVLTDDCLYEIFIRNSRINKYSKSGE